MKTRNMTTGTPWKLILAVALPLMLGNVFQQLYTVVDTAVVGHVLGVNALAALGASDWFNWMFLSIIQGLTQGFTIPVAQEYGANNPTALRRNIAASIKLAAVIGIMLCAVALVSITPVLTLLKTPDTILPVSRNYLRILFAGTPVLMAYNLMAGILRALGDGKSPLIAMVIASVTNIVLDVLFVVYFGWGVEGAAIATVIAQVTSCIFCLYRFRDLEIVHLKKSDFAPGQDISLRQLKLGTPLAMQNIIICVGGMILQRVVNNMGVLFIAGFTATNKLYGLLEVAATSSGYALTTYVGQNLGAKKYARIRKGLHSAVAINIVIAAVVGVLMLFCGKFILGLFITGSPEETAVSLNYAYEFLATMSVGLPILYILYTYRSALQGLGNTLMPMMSGFAEFVMRTAAALLLPGLIGYWGIFFAEVLAWLGADMILVSSYYRNMRAFPKEDEAI